MRKSYKARFKCKFILDMNAKTLVANSIRKNAFFEKIIKFHSRAFAIHIILATLNCRQHKKKFLNKIKCIKIRRNQMVI